MNFINDINKAVEIIKREGTILYPTDTIWGIGCDATNEKAVKKIYDIKKRSEAKSLIILVSDLTMLEKYVDEVPSVAYELIEYSEKPLTIIYDKGVYLAENTLADDGSIGIRVTNDEFCKTLIQKLRKPIVSTSANISGEAAPSRFDDISEEIKSSVDYVVEYRQDDFSTSAPSTIIKLKNSGEIQIIRK